MESGFSRARLDPATGERFVRLRDELGVSSFGINQMALQPGQQGRIHRHARQEEVYLVLEGELTVEIEGEAGGAEAGGAPNVEVIGEGELVRVAPELKRRLGNRGSGRCILLALGGAGEHEGRDGEAFTDWDQQRGAPPQEVPLPPDLEL